MEREKDKGLEPYLFRSLTWDAPAMDLDPQLAATYKWNKIPFSTTKWTYPTMTLHRIGNQMVIAKQETYDWEKHAK